MTNKKVIVNRPSQLSTRKQFVGKTRILYLELGVGNNTPVIIQYPFWRYTLENPEAIYACVNFGQAYAPREIAERSVCLNADIGGILSELNRNPDQ